MREFAVLGKKKRTKYPTWVLIAENVTEDEAQHIKRINTHNFHDIIRR